MEIRRAICMGLVFFVLLNLAFSSLVQAAPGPSISVSPASVEVSQGETFTIEIVVDPKGEEIYAAQYDLYFDPNLLNATSQTKGTFLSQDGTNAIEVINKINNTIGKIEYGETRTAERGISDSGVLASISFEVIGTSGTSDLTLGDVILSDINGKVFESEIGGGTCTVGGVTGEPAVIDITVEKAHEMLEEEPEEIILLDVRTKKEYDSEHIPEAKLIPLPELGNRIGELDKSKKIIVYCKTGSRSRTASEILVQHGFEHVYNMLGGIEEWKIYFPVTSLLTPTPPITVTPSPPALSPPPSLTPAASPAASPTSGFGAITATIGLLAMSYFIIKRKRRR
ncbi:MAG: hypothetical protein C4B56_04470 [Candidatus Methanophagaceae archaeon]|nr:MAG: hypothetical protein C4B56_04470 [Methanophagales archaeon]